MREIAPTTLHFLLESGSTVAVLDVREHGEYNAAHIPGSTSVPRRLLEWRVDRLVPFRGEQVVVCDDDGRRARLAARTLEALGYDRVALLDGGINAWVSDRLPTEWGMNVVSKDFGEKVEVVHHVPTIDARELNQLIESGEQLLIVDTRTPEEYRRFCIPGARSIPNGELALRAPELARQAGDATIVIHCAGRTRSIIGARLLQRMGIENVVSLRNGTAGWRLAGLALEGGADRLDLPEPSPEARSEAEAFAERAAAEDGVRWLDVDGLRELLATADRQTVYPVDVRTEAEYAGGHIPGFAWFPGGQAVQRADDVAPVKNGVVVFACDGTARAGVAASWYRQLGFPTVYALRGGTAAWTAAGHRLETGADEGAPLGLDAALDGLRRFTPAALAAALDGANPPVVLFVETSQEFARGHVPGARWVSRGWLEFEADKLAPDRGRTVVVTDREGSNAAFAAATLRSLGYEDAAILQGGTAAWRAAGLPLETGLSGVMAPPDDVVAAGTDRSMADAIQYLRWEEELGRKYEVKS